MNMLDCGLYPYDINDEVTRLVRKFTVEVVEHQEEIIMNAIVGIGGETYEYITIDKNKVIELFEKSIPKKPLFIDGDYGLPLCPKCGLSVDENEKENYCSVCGQALDWSEKE